MESCSHDIFTPEGMRDFVDLARPLMGASAHVHDLCFGMQSLKWDMKLESLTGEVPKF